MFDRVNDTPKKGVGGFSARRSRLVLLMVAVVAMIAVPVSASSFEFTTQGSFDGGAFGSGAGTSLTVDGGAGPGTGSTIQFNGASLITGPDLTTPTDASFGQFVTTNNLDIGDVDNLVGHTFQLKILQTVPTVGNGTLAALFSGVFTRDASGLSGNVILTFTTAQTFVPIGGGLVNVYSIKTLNNPLAITPRSTVDVAGRVETQPASFVPLPAAVWGCMGLMGLVAAGKVRKARLTA